MNFLSKETIAAIRDAEARAEQIRAESASRAARLVADEKAAGELLLANTDAETRARIDAEFADLKANTERLLEKRRAEAEEEATVEDEAVEA